MPAYIRDNRSPTPKNEAVSRVMSANRAKDTKPELLLRKALWHLGVRGYRLHHKIKLPAAALVPHSAFRTPHSTVRPDISFVRHKVAIFVNGCYWHHCPKCNLPNPKNNPDFWQAKFTRNTARDKQKTADLKRLDWKVIIVWECDLKNRFDRVLRTIQKALS